MSHTGGTTVPGFPGYAVGATVPDVAGVLEGRGNTDPIVVDIEPGTVERYSGGGTTLLQMALEDTTGRPFPELLQERVLTPAGMVDSAFEQPPAGERAVQAARAHTWPENPDGSGQPPPGTPSVRRESPWHVYPELAAAGLWTTPSDRWSRWPR